MQRSEITAWLRETDEDRLAGLWLRADRTRQRHVGDEVHLRGLIELSNNCVRLCRYCGLRAANADIERYRMSSRQVLACARKGAELGYGTVVLQAGEDPVITADWMAQIIARIKAQTPLAVTLSLGERSDKELAAWREAGADRYLLRFETSNRQLYDRIHPARPGQQRSDRVAILGTLRRLGYEVGSGVMIGIPGQTYGDLARDIELFARLDLDMIGVGPYLVHPGTPLADTANRPFAPHEQQVPNDELTTYKVIALARLVCPRTNIPGTTALATVGGEEGRELSLLRGANVIMPNITPTRYRKLYEVYPGKADDGSDDEAFRDGLTARIRAMGRRPGTGRGDSPNFVAPAAAATGRLSAPTQSEGVFGKSPLYLWERGRG